MIRGSATKESGTVTDPFGNYTAYLADEVAPPLACARQHHICIPSRTGDNRCTRFGGARDIYFDDSHPISNMTNWMYTASNPYGFSDVLSTLGADILKAKDSLKGNLQAALPDNQWQLEIERLFQVYMASIQNGAVDSALGPNSEAMKVFVAKSFEKEGQYFCKNQACPSICYENVGVLADLKVQKIRSTAHSNFSVLGLVIVFVIGGLFIVLQWTIQWIYIKMIWHFPRFNQYKRLEWVTNGTLQLQRSAHEQLGYGTWTRCDREIPMPDPYEKLAVLDIEELEHPRLKVAKRARKMDKLETLGTEENSLRTMTDFMRLETEYTLIDSDRSSDRGVAL